MILLIDNYDSFSYNLYQAVGTINPDIRVIRNDELTVDGIAALHPEKIILSPGPGYPKDAGVCLDAVARLGPQIPVLGVCLGHQGICQVFGATIDHAKRLMHGKQSPVRLDLSSPLFKGLPDFRQTRIAMLRAETVESLFEIMESTRPLIRAAEAAQRA